VPDYLVENKRVPGLYVKIEKNEWVIRTKQCIHNHLKLEKNKEKILKKLEMKVAEASFRFK
jgi:hypothetical protein